MTTVIDAPGIAKKAKISVDALWGRVRELNNERQRKLRRLKRAQLKLAGLKALKKDLRPYLQLGDYEHIEDRLQREIKQRRQEEHELDIRLRKERPAARLAELRHPDRNQMKGDF